MMMTKPFQEASTALQSLHGLHCWHVSCGDSTLPSFQLALGGKVARRVPLRNPAQSEEYRQFEGEASLLVWCSWRLDGPEAPVTSSDDVSEAICQGLECLRGAAVLDTVVTGAAGDVRIDFAGGLRLHVFCDHLPGQPSFDGNWEVWLPEVAVFVGPGARQVVQPRTVEAPLAVPR